MTVRIFDVSTVVYVGNKLEQITVRLELDIDRLARNLGQKAVRSKARTSKLAVGVKASVSLDELHRVSKEPQP